MTQKVSMQEYAKLASQPQDKEYILKICRKHLADNKNREKHKRCWIRFRIGSDNPEWYGIWIEHSSCGWDLCEKQFYQVPHRDMLYIMTKLIEDEEKEGEK